MSGLATAFVGRLRRPLLTMSESTILGITIIAPNAALAFGPPPPPPGLWWCPSRPGPRWASSCAAGRAYRTTAAATIQLARMDPSLANATNVAARLT
jgi:hypothetical protein